MSAELMRRLGYDRYGVQGGDFGAYVVPEVADAHRGRTARAAGSAGRGAVR
ncbi:hypothetical protein ACQEU8_24125 [Streptomyces sp. CA-250714]